MEPQILGEQEEILTSLRFKANMDTNLQVVLFINAEIEVENSN